MKDKYALERPDLEIIRMMREEYSLMKTYDIVRNKFEVTLEEIAKELGEPIEKTQKYVEELERVGYVSVERVKRSKNLTLIKLKKDLLDKVYKEMTKEEK